MTLQELLNSIRFFWNIDPGQYLACINAEDREFLGDVLILERFRRDPFRAFVSLPTQDQERVFAIIERKNKEAGL